MILAPSAVLYTVSKVHTNALLRLPVLWLRQFNGAKGGYEPVSTSTPWCLSGVVD